VVQRVGPKVWNTVASRSDLHFTRNAFWVRSTTGEGGQHIRSQEIIKATASQRVSRRSEKQAARRCGRPAPHACRQSGVGSFSGAAGLDGGVC